MRAIKVLLPLIVAVLALMPFSLSSATPSQDFYAQEREVFDDWNVCRTRAFDEDGFLQITRTGEFRPIIALESLGDNTDKAYELGKQFAEKYPDLHQRAERIFYFVRDNVRYISDSDQFDFDEFAQNADEIVLTIEEKGFARGDCEDYAVLLAVMYLGAGYRSAIVLAPGHAAALVHLPGYKKANRVFTIDGESGWIWAEATGRNNPLGWMPERYSRAELAACEVSDGEITVDEPPTAPKTTITKSDGSAGLSISPFFSVIGLMFLFSMLGRRRRRPGGRK